jgi:hypothetical protein
VDQAKRLKELERENARLKKLVADAELDKAMLQEPPRETSEPAAEAEAVQAVRWIASASPNGGRAGARQPRATQRTCHRCGTMRAADAADHRAGGGVRPVRAPADHGDAESQRGLACEPQAGGTDLAAAEGLKVPQRQPKRGRLWLNDGSCIRLRPEHKDHVWAYDFVTLGRMTAGRSGC